MHVSTTFGFSRIIRQDPSQPETGSHLAQVIVELLSADRRTADTAVTRLVDAQDTFS